MSVGFIAPFYLRADDRCEKLVMMRHMKRTHGFSLIELLVVLALAAILLLLAVPGMRGFLAGVRLDAATTDFAGALALARSEAIRRGGRVALRNTAGGGNWGGGWQAFVDSDSDGVPDASETVLRRQAALPTPLTLYANANYTNYIAFKADGTVNNVGSFIFCHDGVLVDAGQSRSRALIVSWAGRVRLAQDSDGDGLPEKDSGEITSCTSP
jgi:type IV fimbrial biogenesis protein FimT